MMARLPGPSIFFSLALLSKSMRSVSALFRKASRKSRRVAPKAKENKSTPTFVSTPVSPSNANKRPKSSPKKVRSASGVPSTKGKHVKTNVLYVHVPNGGNRVTVHGINNGMYYTMAGDPLGTLHKNPSFIPHKHLPPLAPSAPLPPLPPLPPSQRVKDRMTAIREKIVELGDSTHHSRINELERIRNRIKSIQAKQKVRSASGVPSTKGKNVKTNVLYVHVPNGGNRVTVHGINNGMYYTMAGDPLGTLHKNPSFIPHKHLPPLAPSAPLPPLPPLPPSQRVKDRMTAIREKIVELGDSTHHSRINELERIRNRIKSIQAKHGAERYRHPRNNALQNNLSARRHPPSYTNRQLKTLLENYARLLQKKYPNLLELN